MDFGTLSYIGHLPKILLGELLYSLKAQKETGLLYVRRDKVAKRLYFKNGDLIHIESPFAREQLICRLIEQKKIPIPAGIEILQKAIENKKSPNVELLGQPGFSEEAIIESRTKNMRDRLLEVLTWNNGQFAFFFDRTPGSDVSLLPSPICIEEIIYEGLKTKGDKAQLKSLILNHLDQVWHLKADVEGIQKNLKLHTQEIGLLKRFDGSATVERIIYTSRMDMQTTLALLLTLKILRFAGTDDMPDDYSDYEVPTSSNLSIDEVSYAQRLLQSGPALLNKTPFELLQVGRSFGDTDLRKGYYQLAQRYHQREIIDKYPDFLVQLSNRIFERISNSFEALLQVEKAQRDKSLEMYDELDDQLFDNNQKLIHATIRYLQGRLAYNETRFDLAYGLFNDAITQFPNESEFRTYKALCILHKDSSDFIKTAEDSIQELKRAQTIDSRYLPALLSMGEAYEAMNKRELAHKAYKEAQLLAPGDADLKNKYRATKEPFTLDTEDQIEKDDGKRKEMEDKLHAFLKEHENSTYFEVLGVSEDASTNDIRHAYFSLAKDFHPDRMGSMKNHPLAEEVFLRINNAYGVLSSDKKRRFYQRSLKSKEREAEFIKSQRQLKTDKMLTKAKSFLNEGSYEEAFELFRKIDKERQGCHVCKAYMGYTLFLKDLKTNPNIHLEAEKFLEQSLDLEPDFLDAYVLWGKMYRQLNQFSKAVRYFQKVLDKDPDNVEALREMRLINQRHRISEKESNFASQNSNQTPSPKSGEEKKGLFGSIFGRKK